MRNAHGDIIKIIDDSGNVVVEYAYDAWSYVFSTTGSMAATLGTDNPFRYRGYFFDTETGNYYLNQRYYNPEWGRFINADSYMGQSGGLLLHNLFAYCTNNPVIKSDPSGNLEIICDDACGKPITYNPHNAYSALKAITYVTLLNRYGNKIGGYNGYELSTIKDSSGVIAASIRKSTMTSGKSMTDISGYVLYGSRESFLKYKERFAIGSDIQDLIGFGGGGLSAVTIMKVIKTGASPAAPVIVMGLQGLRNMARYENWLGSNLESTSGEFISIPGSLTVINSCGFGCPFEVYGPTGSHDIYR